MLGRIIRTAIITGLIVLFLSLIIVSASTKPSLETKVWDARTTVGSLNAKYHYIMYTDLMCPYCDVFSRVVKDNLDEFKRDYIDGKSILFEMRVTDFLYEFGMHKTEYSRQSAEAIYCATAEDRFWDYYYAALDKLWEDYHSQGIGVSKTGPEITGIDDSYWLGIGESIGLSEDFADCYTSHRELDHVKENTGKASTLTGGGVPYFQFGKFTTSGFDQGWGWDYVKRYLDAGLQQK